MLIKLIKRKCFALQWHFFRIQWQKRYTCIPIVLIFSVDLGFKRMQNNINAKIIIQTYFLNYEYFKKKTVSLPKSELQNCVWGCLDAHEQASVLVKTRVKTTQINASLFILIATCGIHVCVYMIYIYIYIRKWHFGIDLFIKNRIWIIWECGHVTFIFICFYMRLKNENDTC